MKIISKIKDYYDYMVGIYGMDPLIVYDRRDMNTTGVEYPNQNGYDSRIFYICGRIYKLYYYKDNVYHTVDELITLNKLLKEDGQDYLLTNRWRGITTSAKDHFDKVNGKTDVNYKYKEPVLMFDKILFHRGTNYDRSAYCVPLLREYGLVKYIPAEQMFQDVYSFLSKLKDIDIPDNQTDVEKITSHGFDKRISFRHRT